MQVIEKVLRHQKDHLCEKIARYTNMRKKAWHIDVGDTRRPCGDISEMDYVSVTFVTVYSI